MLGLGVHFHPHDLLHTSLTEVGAATGNELAECRPDFDILLTL